MAVAKVILNGTTLIDATVATAVASDITSPKTAMLADGVMTTGTGSGGGGDLQINELLERTISGTYSNSVISTLGFAAFGGCTNIESVNLPNVETIGSSAFTNCVNLVSVYAPKASIISSYAFGGCSSLKDIVLSSQYSSVANYTFSNCVALSMISFPNVTNISNYAFQMCTSLENVSLPNLETVGTNAFRSCSALSSVEFSKVTTINSYAFANCIGLQYASFKACSSVFSSAFQSCTALRSVYLGSVTNILVSTFLSCYSLETINLPAFRTCNGLAFTNLWGLQCVVLGDPSASTFPYDAGTTGIQTNAFSRCYHLTSLYLLYSLGVVKLGGTNVFSSTPISNYTTSTGGVFGSIFVPSAVYSSYISATNWATYSARIVSLTDVEIAALPFL